MDTVLMIIGAVLLLAAAFVAYVIISCRSTLGEIRRLDKDGLLYYIRYKGNYYRRPIHHITTSVRGVGCSAFTTKAEDADNDFITCRNMDYPHFDKKGKVTGLNTVIRLNPKGKYRSVNMADVYWLTRRGLQYVKGTLDDGVTPRFPLALLPWICLDGINEKGLCVSVLALDVKEGEKPVAQKIKGRKTVVITELLRLLLDNCATLEEAKEYATGVNMFNTMNENYHLFVTDAGGHSAVFEWRYDDFYITETDAVTNCYVAFDDVADCYMDGKLYEAGTEKWESLRPYNMGFGHGYTRYNKIIASLDHHRDTDDGYSSKMTLGEAEGILESVYQVCDGTDMTSQTQYCCLYNNEKRTVSVWTLDDTAKKYDFEV